MKDYPQTLLECQIEHFAGNDVVLANGQIECIVVRNKRYSKRKLKELLLEG